MEQIVADQPQYCAHCTKTNAKGYKESWSGYKLHTPLFEYNTRGGEKREFEPWHAHLHKDRTGRSGQTLNSKTGADYAMCGVLA